MTNDDLWDGHYLDPGDGGDICKAVEIMAEKISPGAHPYEWRISARWAASIARAIKKHAEKLTREEMA